jgi:hypothetical protein
VEDVFLKDVTIAAQRGARLEYVTNLVRDNVKITPTGGDAWTMTNVTAGAEASQSR